MDAIDVLPNKPIAGAGVMSERFLTMGVHDFHEACDHVHRMPYGYNSDRDDLMILFTEGKGSCTTKHAVIATLAAELALPVEKHIGVYAMTEDLVTGTAALLTRHRLPYVPMIHCFLVSGARRVDLTEGNDNGKNRPIDVFLHTEAVSPMISAKNEYLRYRRALTDRILKQPEFAGISIGTVLKAREAGIVLLRARIGA